MIGHSRWGHAVYASDEDSDRIDDLLWLFFPNSDRYATDRSSTHNLRDAMHIATALRYRYDAFVTADTRLLKKADAIRRGCGIELLLPSEAVRLVEHRIARQPLGEEGR